MKFTNILLALSLSATVAYAADAGSTAAIHSTAVVQSAPNPSSTGHDQGGSHGKGKHEHSGKGNHTHSALEAECDKIHHLTELVDLAKNTTKLNELASKHHLNATEIGKIKEKAANATTKLNKLESNATLVSECAKIKVGEKVADSKYLYPHSELSWWLTMYIEGLANSTASAQAAQSTYGAAIGLAVSKGLLSISVLTGLAIIGIA